MVFFTPAITAHPKTQRFRTNLGEIKQGMRARLFHTVRKLHILPLLNRLGLSICRGYLPVNISSTENLLKQNSSVLIYRKQADINSTATQPPFTVAEQSLAGFDSLKASIETVVLEIEDRRFAFCNNHLLDPHLNVIDENCYCFEQLPISKQLLARPRKLNGTVAYLTNADPSNFYHWMCRILPTLHFYEAQWGLHNIDYFYVGDNPLKSFHLESLAKANIPPSKMVNQACRADRLVAAIPNRTLFGGSAPINETYYQYSRQLFEDIWAAVPQQKKRIYVTRGNAVRRQVINEAEVISLLETYGFEIVTMNQRSLAQQAALFAQAEAVIAPHGAALTNLLFVKPYTKVIELIPQGYANNCFYVLANYGQAQYSYLVGEDTHQVAILPHWRDIFIDLDKLQQIIKYCLKY
jgi:hypothetical protein